MQFEPEELTLIHNLRKMMKNDWVKKPLTYYYNTDCTHSELFTLNLRHVHTKKI